MPADVDVRACGVQLEFGFAAEQGECSEERLRIVPSNAYRKSALLWELVQRRSGELQRVEFHKSG